MTKVLTRLEEGQGRMEDIALLTDVGGNILFKAFCALADGAVSPVDSSIKHFSEEYEQHVKQKGCPFKERTPLQAARTRKGGVAGAIPLAEILPEEALS
jgi:NADH-quinone oxidoreductase subunit F